MLGLQAIYLKELCCVNAGKSQIPDEFNTELHFIMEELYDTLLINRQVSSEISDIFLDNKSETCQKKFCPQLCNVQYPKSTTLRHIYT